MLQRINAALEILKAQFTEIYVMINEKLASIFQTELKRGNTDLISWIFKELKLNRLLSNSSGSGRDGGLDHSVWRQGGGGGKHANIWLLWDWTRPKPVAYLASSPVCYNSKISINSL